MKNKLNKNLAKTAFFAFVVTTLFFAVVIQASFGAETIKYDEMEKQEIDSNGDKVLNEYYGELLGYVKKNAKFNNIATADDIAIFNVTINGKDTRILTRLRTGAALSGQALANTTNLVVLGNISLKGILYSEVETNFGERRFYGLESTTLKYTDEGFARLVNGKANVSINPILRELIGSYSVFLSVEGLTQGIYIAEKTHSYFIVKSVNANSNVAFSWMLRGARKEVDNYLTSEYGLREGIDVTAKINFENGRTNVKINGLNKILGLINLSASINLGNKSNENQTNDGINLITGNLIDEFGLETDLGQILGEATPLPGFENTSSEEETVNETPIVNETVGLGNGTVGLNETTEANETIQSVLEFTVYSTNEEHVMSQIADVTGLSLGQVRKLVNFVYAEPEGFEDEIIEPQTGKIDGIEKINGSVIITLG